MRERCGELQGEVAEVRGAAKEQEVHLRAQLSQAEVDGRQHHHCTAVLVVQ